MYELTRAEIAPRYRGWRANEKLTLGQSARLAGMSQYRFQLVLASRDIHIHYDFEEYPEDVQTIESFIFASLCEISRFK